MECRTARRYNVPHLSHGIGSAGGKCERISVFSISYGIPGLGCLVFVRERGSCESFKVAAMEQFTLRNEMLYSFWPQCKLL